jgi:hypothetical protein
MNTPSTPQDPFAPRNASARESDNSTGEGLVAGGQAVDSSRGTAWWSDGWTIFMKQPGTWIGLFLIFMVIMIVLGVIPLVGGLASSLLGPVFTAGFMIGCRDLQRGESLTVEHVFAGFKQNVGNLVIVGLLYLVGVIVVMVTIGVFTAVMIPVIIGVKGSAPSMTVIVPLAIVGFLVILALVTPLIMALWFAPALVVFHNQAPMEAMKSSFRGCLKNVVPFLLYGIVGLVLAIIAIIPVGLGFLVLGPVMWGSMYSSYRDIFVERS